MRITITRFAARCCSLLTIISLASAAIPSIDFARAQEIIPARRSDSKLDADFRFAAKEFGVPRDLLAAIAYAERNGIPYRVAEPTPRRHLLRQNGYGDNFAFTRRNAWTH